MLEQFPYHMINQLWLTHGQYQYPTKKRLIILWPVENTNILGQVSAHLDWIPQAVPWLSVKIAMGWLYVWYFGLLYVICIENFFGAKEKLLSPGRSGWVYKLDLTLIYHKILPSWIFQVIAIGQNWAPQSHFEPRYLQAVAWRVHCSWTWCKGCKGKIICEYD